MSMPMTTGSKRADAYFVASARASAPAAAASHPEVRDRSLARTADQADSASRHSDMASKVANAPSRIVAPVIANTAVAKNAAVPPNTRRAVPHSKADAPSMNSRERIRAPASPPTLSASAPSGG